MKKIVVYIYFSLLLCSSLYGQPAVTDQLGIIPLTDKIEKTIQKTGTGIGNLYITPSFEITSPALVTVTVQGSGFGNIPQIYELLAGQTPPYNTYSNGLTTLTKLLYAGKYLIHTVAGNSGGMTMKISFTPIKSDKEALFTQNANYITISFPQIGKSVIDHNSKEELVTVQYFDGLGRLEQTVQKNVSPTLKDLISLQEYDIFGRQNVSWLPGVIENNNGMYVSPSTLKPEIKAYYNNESAPFNSITYESSPLNRILTKHGPGAEWRALTPGLATEYLTNTSEFVCANYTSTDDGKTVSIVRNSNHAVNTLYVVKSTDEDKNITYEFKNKNGQTILSRQINNTQSHDTYYIYDKYNNLRAVLPPLLSDKYLENNSFTFIESNLDLQQLGYIYKYDERNRCIAKKLPGCDWTYYIYDKADRLIFTQDGEQRKKTPAEWTFTIPDALGRTMLTGISQNVFTYTANPLANIVVNGEWAKTTNINKGYTITGVTLTNATILAVNYYDNYEFMGLNGVPASTDTNFKYTAESDYGIWYAGDYTDTNKYKNKEMLTGTLTAQFKPDGTVSPDYLYSVMYYDYKGQLVQTSSNSHLTGGLEKEYIAYNFTGQPAKRKHMHSATGKTTQTEFYSFVYDHAGRLLKTTHQLQEGTATPKIAVVLAENTYDEQGRLLTNRKGSNDNLKSTYGYNIRSWTKSISSPLFKQSLYYNESYGENVRRHNGNISAMDWTVSGDKTRGYTFVYDNLSQLTAANYLEGGVASTNYKTAYTYDKHGNMKTLQRYGKTTTGSTFGLIDNLTVSHTGNQMLKVDETIATISMSESADFKNYSNVATEYYYNANGAMYKDLNKGISNIQYNTLNLPRIMDIKSPVAEARNEYTYSASGTKLKVVQKWNPNFSTAPVIGSDITPTLLTKTETTDYIGNIIYESHSDGTSKTRILVDGGYIDGGIYYFYLTDHLGNNRVVANASGTIIQKNHYYPFGMAFAETSLAEQKLQSYKYNNKEFDQMHGLNLYDYSARYMDATLPTLPTVDPLAETSYNWSPYVYVENNPVRYTDPTGMKKGDPDDPYVLPEVVVTPSVPEKGDQVLTPESGAWNIWYITLGSPREYIPSYKAPASSSGFDTKYATFIVGTDGKIIGPKPNIITGTPFIPAIGGGNLLGVVRSASKGRVFWSGGNKAMKAAADYAKANGQTTLEMTRAGQNLSNLTKDMPWSEAAPLWRTMSATYANGVKNGSVIHVFHNAETGVSLNSIWRTVEYSILKSKNVNIIYHSVP